MNIPYLVNAFIDIIYENHQEVCDLDDDREEKKSIYDSLMTLLKDWQKDKRSGSWDTLSKSKSSELGNAFLYLLKKDKEETPYIHPVIERLIIQQYPFKNKADELLARCFALSTDSTEGLSESMRRFIQHAKSHYALSFPNRKELLEDRIAYINSWLMLSKEVDLTKTQYHHQRINIIFCKEGNKSQTDVITALEQYINKLQERDPNRTILVIDEYEMLERTLSACDHHKITVHFTNIAHGSELSLGFLDIPEDIKEGLINWIHIKSSLDTANDKHDKALKRLNLDIEKLSSSLNNDKTKLDETHQTLSIESTTKPLPILKEKNKHLAFSQKLKTRIGARSLKLDNLRRRKRDLIDSFAMSKREHLYKAALAINHVVVLLKQHQIHNLEKEHIEFIYDKMLSLNLSRTRIIGAFLDNIRINIGTFSKEIDAFVDLINTHPSIHRVRLLSCMSAEINKDRVEFSLQDSGSAPVVASSNYEGRTLNQVSIIQDPKDLDKKDAIRSIVSRLNREHVIVKGETDVINPGLEGKLIYNSTILPNTELYVPNPPPESHNASAGSLRFFSTPKSSDAYTQAIRDTILLIETLHKADKLSIDEETLAKASKICHRLNEYPADTANKARRDSLPWKRKYVLALKAKLDNLIRQSERTLEPHDKKICGNMV